MTTSKLSPGRCDTFPAGPTPAAPAPAQPLARRASASPTSGADTQRCDTSGHRSDIIRLHEGRVARFQSSRSIAPDIEGGSTDEHRAEAEHGATRLGEQRVDHEQTGRADEENRRQGIARHAEWAVR